MTLPLNAPNSWGDERLRLRYKIPKIWTQAQSRSFGIYWSDSLGFGRLWPEPTDDELKSFYDISTYSEYLSGNSLPQRRASGLVARSVVKIAYLADRGIEDPLPSIASLAREARTVCDVGCGGGNFLLRIATERGLRATGIDPSPVSREALRRKNIEFFAGTAEELPAATSGLKFDIVSMFQSLEHCRRPSLAIANVSTLLSDDGLLVIDVPNMECVGFDKYGPAWWHTDAGRHLQFFTRSSLSALLAEHGLTPVKWEFQGFVSQFTPAWIEDMANVWDHVQTREVPRPSLAASLSYLPQSLVAPSVKKYEIVRVFAKWK